MTEEVFSTIQRVIAQVEIFLFSLNLGWFLSKTFVHKYKRKWGMFLVVVGYNAFYIFRALVVDVSSWVGCIAIYILLVVALKEKEKQRWVFLAYLIVTWYCVLHICTLIENSLYQIATNFLLCIFYDLQVFFVWLLHLYCFGALLRVSLLFAMIAMIEKKIQIWNERLKAKDLWYLLCMPVAGVLFGNIILKVMLMFKEDVYFNFFEENPIMIGIVPLVGLLFYGAILFSISAYSDMLSLQEEKKKNFVKEQKVLALKERMKEVKEYYENARQIKHDFRNHMATIKGLLAQNDYVSAGNYIDQMQYNINVFEFQIHTGNAVMDVILNDYRKKAEAEGVVFQVEVTYEEEIKIDDFDLGIVMSNLLENALEACRRENNSYIRIVTKKCKKFYVIEVRNNFWGEIQWDDNMGIPISTKCDSSFHGIGLGNVKKVIEKYLGSMDIETQNQEFCIRVMMQEKGGTL